MQNSDVDIPDQDFNGQDKVKDVHSMNEIRHTQQPTLPDASDPVPVNPFGSDVVAARGLCSYDHLRKWKRVVFLFLTWVLFVYVHLKLNNL